MTHDSLVSIVIPTYNRADLLPRALESVMAQSYQNIECIIVDDGSTDNTKSVIRNLSNQVTYLETSHKGPSHARNVGMKAANGKYIAFLDSDDYYYSSKIEIETTYMESYPDIGMVFTEWSGRHMNGAIEEFFLRSYHPTWEKMGWSFGDVFTEQGVLETACLDFHVDWYSGAIFPFVVAGTLITTNTMLFRKDILQHVGLQNESYRLGEDYEFALRICKRCRVAFINFPTYVHCFNPTQINPFSEKSRYDEKETILKKIEGLNVLLCAVLDWAYRDQEFYPANHHIVDSRIVELNKEIGSLWVQFGNGVEARKCLRHIYKFEKRILYFLSRWFISFAPNHLLLLIARLRNRARR